MLRVFMVVVLGLILSACTASLLAPPRALIEKGVVWQFQQIQTQLEKNLDIDIQDVDIKNIAIAQQKPLSIDNLPAFQIQGTYDVELKLAKHQLKQPHKSFNLYMQIQREGKTWRLLEPITENGKQSNWKSYAIE